MAKYSEAQKRAVAKYNLKTYDEIKLRVPKGKKIRLQEYCKGQGKSVNALINDLIDKHVPIE